MRPSSNVLAEELVVVPALAQELDAVHGALERLWAIADRGCLPRLGETWRAEFATAVGEISANIARHAHPAGRPPGTMCLRLRLFSAKIEARFTDNGVAYTAYPVAAPTDGQPAEGGYGLMLVRSTTDQLRYHRTRGGTNVWRLTKRFARPVVDTG